MSNDATPREVGSHEGLGLVERLRQQFPDVPYHRDQLHRDAADEIERAWAARDAAVADLEACVEAEVRRAVAAERERHADALRCALEALDYCIEDSAELLNERTVQWGSFRKDRQAAMAATLERHRAVAERMRAMLRA